MPLFYVQNGSLLPVPPTTFAQEAVMERSHLQAMLKLDTAPLGEELLVLTEEFGHWEDSNRRIDLLCLSRNGGLVVVEIKRTEDGGHMELQAIRYAAMVSSMTLDQAIHAHSRYLGGEAASERARKAVLDFIDVASLGEAELQEQVRIILVSADFSQEITTAVIWLNRQGLDIRCVRLRPYKLGAQLLIDATQIIPLPEAAEYEVKIREQADETRKVRSEWQESVKLFWSQFIERSSVRTTLYRDRRATTDPWLAVGLGRPGFSLTAVINRDSVRLECQIRIGKVNAVANKRAFNALLAQRDQIEAAFGDSLDWREQPDTDLSRILKVFSDGGWSAPEEEWEAIHEWLTDTAIRMEGALRKPVQALEL